MKRAADSFVASENRHLSHDPFMTPTDSPILPGTADESASTSRSGEPCLAVVTGASGGLGSALVRHLVSRGWRILGIDHNEARMEQLARSLPEDAFLPLLCEVQSADLVPILREALRDQPAPTALACVAAVSVGDEIAALTDEDWELSFSVNTTPAMVLARALAPGMAGNRGGAIVNVGSPVGIVGSRKPSYAASKAALSGLTVSLARNLGPLGIRANLFLPGPMITPLTADWPREKRAAIAEGTFLRRLCEPEEAARVVAFLLSEEASYLTGAIIDGTGGSMFGH